MSEEGLSVGARGEIRLRTVGRGCMGSASLAAESEREREWRVQHLLLSYSACLWGVGGRGGRVVCGDCT